MYGIERSYWLIRFFIVLENCGPMGDEQRRLVNFVVNFQILCVSAATIPHISTHTPPAATTAVPTAAVTITLESLRYKSPVEF